MFIKKSKVVIYAVSCIMMFGTAAPINIIAAPTTQNINIDSNANSLIPYVGLTAAGTENNIERKRTGWTMTKEGKKYVFLDGTYAKGVTNIHGKWYALDNHGIPQTGWINNNGIKMFALNEGIIATGIIDIGDEYYSFDKDGIPSKGWAKDDENNLYFADDNGKVVTGLFESDERKYVALDNGVVQTGWIIYGDAKYYQTDLGLLTGVQYIDGDIRIFTENGTLASGIVKINNALYYADEDGYPITGWQDTEKGRIYCESDGMLLTGNQKIDDKNYLFDENGILQKEYTALDFQPMTNDIENEKNSVSLNYNGILYEGEIPDAEKLEAEHASILLSTSTDDSIDVIPENTIDWNSPAYESALLEVETENGKASVEVPVVAVDHVEASYKKEIKEGDKLLLQNILVKAVYEDGTEKIVPSYTCDLPESIDKTTTVSVGSQYGNAELKLTVEKN